MAIMRRYNHVIWPQTAKEKIRSHHAARCYDSTGAALQPRKQRRQKIAGRIFWNKRTRGRPFPIINLGRPSSWRAQRAFLSSVVTATLFKAAPMSAKFTGDKRAKNPAPSTERIAAKLGA